MSYNLKILKTNLFGRQTKMKMPLQSGRRRSDLEVNFVRNSDVGKSDSVHLMSQIFRSGQSMVSVYIVN